MAKTTFQYKNRDVSVSLMRKERNKGEDSAPTFWRITYNRKHKYYPSGFTFTCKDWDKFVNNGLKRHKDIRATLQKFLEKTLKPTINELVEEDDFSFEKLNSKLGRSDVKTLNDAFRAKIKELDSEDRVNYSATFKSTLKSLELFKGDIQFNEVTPDFLKKYEKHLIDEGLTLTTVGIYTRNIRTIINGNGEPFLKGGKYPFGKGRYIIPKGEGREKALRLDQIHLMQAYKCDQATELYRDMWLFSFYGNGINVTDICRLKYEDIRDGEITFIRKKTKSKRRTVTRIYIPMTKPIRDIIQKYGNRDKSGCIFPFLNGVNTEKQRVERINDLTRDINKTVQSIAKELKLPDGITTYSTRHSFVTILEHLNVPRTYISNSLGHTNETVTDNYSNLTEKELRFRYNSLLLLKSNEEVVKSLIESVKKELVFN